MFGSEIEQWEVGFYTLLTDRLTDRQKDGQSQVSKVVTYAKSWGHIYCYKFFDFALIAF